MDAKMTAATKTGGDTKQAPRSSPPTYPKAAARASGESKSASGAKGYDWKANLRARRKNRKPKMDMKIDAKGSDTSISGRTNFLDQLRKGTRSRKRAKYLARNKKLISQLIRDMKRQSKFGKMLSYSLTCLTNLCVDEVSCEELIDSGVLETLADVLRKNPYNEELQQLANSFIKKVSFNEMLKRKVAKVLQPSVLGNSLDNHLDTKTLVSTTDTINHLLSIRSNKDLGGKLITEEKILPKLCNVLHRNNQEQADSEEKDSSIAESTSTLVNTMVSQSPEYSRQIVESGLCDELMMAMEIHPGSEKLAFNFLSAIKTMSEHDPSLVPLLKKRGVVGRIVACLERNPDNELLTKIGAGALKALGTTGEIGNAMKRLKDVDGGAMATVGALSLVGKNVEYLIKNGGIPLITGLLRDLLDQKDLDLAKDENARRFIINGCRALQNMATDENNIYQLMREKAPQLLLKVISKAKDDPEVISAAFGALTQMCSRAANADYLMKCGVLASALEIARGLARKDATVAKKTLGLLSALCKSQEVARAILQQQGAQEVVQLMRLHKGDKGVQLQGLKFINKVIETLGAEGIQAVLAAGGIDAIASALSNFGDDPDVAEQAFTAIEALAGDEAALAALKNAGVLKDVLKIMTSNAKSNPALAAKAAKVAGLLVTEEDIRNYCAQTQALVKRVNAGDEEAIPELVDMTNLLAGLSSVAQNRKLLVKHGVLDAVEKALAAAKRLPDGDDKKAILRNLARTLAELSKDPEIAELIVKRGLHAGMLDAALTVDDDETAIATAALFSELVKSPTCVVAMERDGSIEKLRELENKYEDNEEVSSLISAVYTQVAKTKGGNIREVVELTLESIESSTDPGKIAEDLQYLLKMSAESKEVIEMLTTPSAIKTLMQTMKEHSGNAAIQKATLELLAKVAKGNPELLLQFCKDGGIGVVVRTMRKLFNVPEIVESQLRLLREVSKNGQCLQYFIDRGTADTKLVAWAGKAYKGKNKTIEDAAKFVLQKVAAHHEQLFMIKKEEERKKALAAARAAEEERKRRERGLTKDEMLFALQGLSQNMDAAALDSLIGLMSNPDNVELFVTSGGLEFMKNILLDGNLSDDMFEAAVMCFNSTIGDGKRLVEILGDDAALDMIMKVMDPNNKNLDWDKLGNTINAVLKLTEDKDVLRALLDKGDLKGALLLAASQGKEEDMIVAAMKTLARISNSKEEMLAWATKGNIKALLDAMLANLDKPTFLMYACYLLGNLALNEHVQNLIGELGGVQVITKCLQRYPDNADLIDKACYALRLISAKNAVNCGLVVRYKVHSEIFKAMETHLEANTRFWINVLGLLLNICKNSTSTAEFLQKNECDLRIVEVIYNKDDDKIVRLCCKILERLTTRKTYRALLENSVVHCLNPSLSKSSRYTDSVVAAMKVYQRLAQFAKTDREAMGLFIADNAHKAVVNCVKQHQDNAAILGPSVDCLTHFAYDEICSTTIVRMRIVDVIREALAELDYDERFCSSAISLVDRLTMTSSNLRSIVEAKVIPVMCTTVGNYIGSKVLVLRFLSAARRVCGQSNFAIKLADDVIPTMIKVTTHYLEESGSLIECFNAMKSLTFSDLTAVPISNMSSTLAIKAMKSHYGFHPLQRSVLDYLMALFLQPKAVEEAIFNTKILTELMTKLKSENKTAEMVLETLYEIAISTNKVKDFMKAEEVIHKLNSWKEAHADQKELCAQCDRVITAINTPKMDYDDLNFEHEPHEEFKNVADIWGEKRKAGREKGFQISTKLKNFLIAGMEVKLHKKRKCVDTHLKVSRNLKKIMWTNGKGGNPNFMGVWRMRRVKPGVVSDNLKKKHKGYKIKGNVENRVFVIFGEDGTVSIECQREEMRDKWIRALTDLKKHHKSHKKLATDYLREKKF